MIKKENVWNYIYPNAWANEGWFAIFNWLPFGGGNILYWVNVDAHVTFGLK